jgi:lycopene cyclase domain-containing protein
MTHWPYLPFLLAWALPVLAIQWILGGRYLWRERHTWPFVTLGLCVWFSMADAIAINARIWSFDRASLTGIWLGPVPLEEVLFYLLTAAMCVQGFVTLYGGWNDRRAVAAEWHERIIRLRAWHRKIARKHAAAGTASPRQGAHPAGSSDV